MEIALSSLRFAFESVKENQGCAGVDGVTVWRFENMIKPQRTQRTTEKKQKPENEPLWPSVFSMVKNKLSAMVKKYAKR